MSDEHLKRDPHKFRGTKAAWWYEDEKGLAIIVPALGIVNEPQQVRIPWREIRGAVERVKRLESIVIAADHTLESGVPFGPEWYELVGAMHTLKAGEEKKG